jgi:2-phosphosulfolactate phosphatase
MKLDVEFTPAGLTSAEVQGRTVFVIDVLRASTTICAALTAGARAVVPTSTVEEAIRLAQTLGPEETVLAGERNRFRVPGFTVGNSPSEMAAETVKGKTVIMTTSNGTEALLAVSAAPAFVAGVVNFSLVSERARAACQAGAELLVVCAGRDGRRHRKGLNDSALAALDLVRRYGHAWHRPLALSQSGRELAAAGFAGDVELAATEDAFPVLPVLSERRIVPAATLQS